MMLDDVDLGIIKSLHENELKGIFMSSYAVTKEMFPNLEKYGLIKKNNFMIKRLKRLVKYGIITNRQSSKKKIFYAIDKKIVMGTAKLIVKSNNKKIKLDIGDGFLYRVNDKVAFIKL